jgi:hypothetical protein
VASNRVHLLELSHVNITKATDFALWLSDPSSPYATIFALFLKLLLTLSSELCLDFQCLLSEIVHHALGIGAELRTWTGEAEIERIRRDASLGRAFLREPGWLTRLWIDISEPKAQARIWRLRSTLMDLAGVHLPSGWLDGACGGRRLRRRGRREDGIEVRLRAPSRGLVMLDERCKMVGGIGNGL